MIFAVIDVSVIACCRYQVYKLSRTQIMKVGDVICVVDFHDLCLRQVRDFVANLSRTLSQS